ncbi:hypothetical protein BGW36DRAFT_429852 [Talaromyces proteolyticus]|uniref:Arrestin-like N-terminal domain-containing protein n=1 Tax=Talaromyces proteolyticus TaxID=1131652 RepID=A0AAD4PY87_9EURO|nr:uncharacterized protein BGW36DRAFT_429852 [Talaromyces proteolyticus]KAH8693821.1 hypothetical protein BGW36DRAFT_429852 [Talaromyces proteolyticus]
MSVAPQHDISLVLDRPDKLYTSGDTITGTIHDWKPHLTNGASIEVVLVGRSKSYIDFSAQNFYTYTGRVPLIYHTTQLHPAQSDDELHFAITVPDHVQKDLSSVPALKKRFDYWTHSWSDSEPFAKDPQHALPPSMTMHERSLSLYRQEVRGWGQIRYTLSAIISETAGHGKNSVIQSSEEENVIITTPRISVEDWEREPRENQISANIVTFINKRLQPDAKVKQKGVFDKMMSDDTPKMSVQLHTIVPKIAVSGSTIELFMRLHRPAKRYAKIDFPLPLITLQRAELYIKETITTRCSRPVLRFDEHVYEFPGHPFAGQTCRINHTFIPTVDGTNYQPELCRAKFKIPSSCTPTFKTWNMSSEWSICGTVFFKCLGKETYGTFDSRITLISKPRKSGAGDGEDSEASDDLVDVGEEGDGAAIDWVGGAGQVGGAAMNLANLAT